MVALWGYRRTHELTHAGPKDAAREAEPQAPSGVVCSDFVGRFVFHILRSHTLGDGTPRSIATRLASVRHAIAKSHDRKVNPSKKGTGMKKRKRTP